LFVYSQTPSEESHPLTSILPAITSVGNVLEGHIPS